MSRQDLSAGLVRRRTGREGLQQNPPQMLALQIGSAQLNGIAPGEQTILISSFAGGYVTNVAQEQLPVSASPLMIDWEVSRGDRLVRAPGTSEVEELDHAPSAALVHSNLDASSELLLFAAPFVGVKRDAITVWANEGILPAGHWVGANYAGTYIFTNAREVVYSREAGDAHIRATVIPVGRALAAWNNRLWVANAVINGNFLPMGLVWSSASGGYEDFTGLGTGVEELIYDFSEDDGIVALRPMSLDFMAVLCKKSLWIGTRNNDTNEPANFDPVETGIGCVAEPTARTGYGGVYYLSLVGLQLFDGQKSVNLSEQINAELLPIDQSRIDEYWGRYDATQRRYILGTPTGTWVFDITFNRWYKRSMIAGIAVDFPAETPLLTWDDEVGTWAEATDDWADYDPHGQPDRNIFIQGTSLHQEDYASDSYFGTPFVATWRSKSIMGSKIGELVTVKGISLRYEGKGEIKLRTQNTRGAMQDLLTRNLVDTEGGLWDEAFTAVLTGLRGQIELQLLNGNIEVDAIGITLQADSDLARS